MSVTCRFVCIGFCLSGHLGFMIELDYYIGGGPHKSCMFKFEKSRPQGDGKLSRDRAATALPLVLVSSSYRSDHESDPLGGC